jgi:bifunctional non-homologous end joining protein LigD
MNKRFGRYTVTITHPDKLLLGTFTKGDLIAYYDAISSYMVPYMKDHPLMMLRYPEGLKGESFYQKDTPDYFPEWIQRVAIEKKGGSYNAPLCQHKATLIYIANQGCITPHLWLSKFDKLSFPDRIIFDLDPSDEDFSKVRVIALAIKKLLDELGLISFVMTSGSRGLHIYVPLTRSADFDATKEFTQACAQKIVQEHPDKATLELRKESRHGKVFVDYLRNQQGATAVSPYSIRANIHASVATPLYWHEVEESTLTPQKYTITNLGKRLAKIEDPWTKFFQTKQTVTQARKKLAKK